MCLLIAAVVKRSVRLSNLSSYTLRYSHGTELLPYVACLGRIGDSENGILTNSYVHIMYRKIVIYMKLVSNYQSSSVGQRSKMKLPGHPVTLVPKVFSSYCI